MKQGQRISFYVWVAIALTLGVLAVVFGWNSAGTPNPAVAGSHMSRTSAVIDSAVLVFREGLETVLILAAITASFRGGNRATGDRSSRRGVSAAGDVGTWFAAVWVLGSSAPAVSRSGRDRLLAIVVLMAVMNWFLHRVYWTGWISHHHRRRGLLGGPAARRRGVLLGFGCSASRRSTAKASRSCSSSRTCGSAPARASSSKGSRSGCVHDRRRRDDLLDESGLPYRRILIVTGHPARLVLFVMVGEGVQEMQFAGWLGTTSVGVSLPGWMGHWFALFPNVETIAGRRSRSYSSSGLTWLPRSAPAGASLAPPPFRSPAEVFARCPVVAGPRHGLPEHGSQARR